MIGSIFEQRDQLMALERRRQEVAARQSRKSIADRGATASRGDTMMPGKPAPESFDRDYLSEGHAAEAPMSEGPRENPNPVPSEHRGVPVPIQMSSAALASGIPTHIASAYSMGSPSDR